MDYWVLKDGRYYYLRMEQNCNHNITPIFTTDINSAVLFDDKEYLKFVKNRIWTSCAVTMNIQKVRVYDGFVSELEDKQIKHHNQGYSWDVIDIDGMEISRHNKSFVIKRKDKEIDIDDELIRILYDRLQ